MDNLEAALQQGLTVDEYRRAVSALGREPNHTEIGLIAAMWSEHCSYKSSRIHLRKLPTTGDRVIQGPGENAGVVDIGDGLCVVFKMESHNHPSYIEPYQGAATGVGGILRDIFTMGARPVVLLDSLRFGDPALPKTIYLLEGVVSGIAGYGNCVGVPTVGGELHFEACYNGNPLVNVFALGVTRRDRVFRGRAEGAGNPVIYVGSKTGRDGIHGAVMASDTLSEAAQEKRPAVQVGDPFTEKLLLEACLELFERDVIVGIQDMGAAGLTSSSSEMASRAGTGIRLYLDRVPRREEGMTPYEVMLSESQERMLIVVKKGREEEARQVFEKWGVDFAVIGEVTEGGRMEVLEDGKKVVDLPVALLTDGAPAYDRPARKPAYLDDTAHLDLDEVCARRPDPETVLRVLASPNIASKRWVYEQYDHMVRTDNVVPPGSDAAVIRIKGTNKAVAVTVNCNARYCYLDPRTGAQTAVAESARNLACSGALPLAVTDCLNFGNPENPEVMWQFIEAVEGLAHAARSLGTPVVSGNVSFYNESDLGAVYPTPTVAMVGLVEDLSRVTTQWFKQEGDVIVVLGETAEELGGSEYLKVVHGTVLGRPPRVDLEAEKALVGLLYETIGSGIIKSAHDVSEGGLVVALLEACFTPDGNLGASVDLDAIEVRDCCKLFSESQARAVVSLDERDLEALLKAARRLGVVARAVGRVGGESLSIKGLFDVPLTAARTAWRDGFETLVRSHA